MRLSNPRIFRLPLLGRFAVVPDQGGAADSFPGGLSFHSDLEALVVRAGGKTERVKLGSGLVTNAGVNYLAADFLAASAARINAFNYTDAGTGTVAAAVTDVALGTPYGGARSAGTQSNPAANKYRHAATITFAGTFAITEWGLFSAASAGTMWDRKVFAALNVLSGDAITFTYDLTVNAGG